LQENNNFQKFSRCCEEKSYIEKQLENSKISDEKRGNLKERLDYLNEEISRLRLMIESRVKVS
jgi:hypothetical protein